MSLLAIPPRTSPPRAFVDVEERERGRPFFTSLVARLSLTRSMTWKGRLGAGNLPPVALLVVLTRPHQLGSRATARSEDPSPRSPLIDLLLYENLAHVDARPGATTRSPPDRVPLLGHPPGKSSSGRTPCRSSALAAASTRNSFLPDLADHLVEVPPRLLDHLRPVRELHERVLLVRLRRPVEEEPLGALAVAPFQDVGVGAELPLVGADQLGESTGLLARS